MLDKFSDGVVSQQHVVRPPPLALGINVEKPKFPQYAVYSKRTESFENWPEYLPVKVEDLAEAGLVYTGVGDSVRCYFCGGGLRNWERDDVPMEEHAKWYPKCPHIQLVKGQAYVEKILRRQKTDSSAVETHHHLASIAAQSCIQMNYSKEMVLKAIDIFIKRNGNSDFAAKDLCEILFEIEEESMASSSDNVVDCSALTPHENLESEEMLTPGGVDSVKCYFCDNGLQNWERDDVSKEEHAKLFPKCSHLLIMKRQPSVQKICRGQRYHVISGNSFFKGIDLYDLLHEEPPDFVFVPNYFFDD